MSWIKDNISIVKKNSLNKKKQRQFGSLIVAFLLLVFFVSVYKEGLVFNDKQKISFFVSSLLVIFTWVFPIIFFPFLFIWLFIGNILGEITSFVILGIVYYVLFTPISLFLKKKENTGWIEKNIDADVDYEKLY
ncbi:hypothetical protein GCM10009430_40060 [Aquimarina litoralis]|uniref:DUF4870 domain-containing protein n=1 Tax=Aquimarina litoralis TaxID=584605 RepID=A0ABP3UFS1_9FLAO